MYLTDLMDKHQQIQFQLFSYFLSHGPDVSTHQLEETRIASLPTLVRELDLLEEQLQLFQHEATLTKVRSESYQLFLPNHFNVAAFINFYLKKTLNHQLLCFVYQQKEVSTTKLTLAFQISEASLFRHLKEINLYLDEFDLQFRNKNIVGNEWQLRIFYFQMFWHSLTIMDKKEKWLHTPLHPLIEIIQHQLHIDFSEEEHLKLSLWLDIMQKRLDYREKARHVIPDVLWEKIRTDTTYQKIKMIMVRYLSRYALAWSEYEAAYLYLFLLTLTPEAFLETPLITYIKQMNTELLRSLDINETSYQKLLTQAHLAVFLTKGTIEKIPRTKIRLSDKKPEKMTNCMDLVEKKLSKRVSHLQWQQLDELYGGIWFAHSHEKQARHKIGLQLKYDIETETIRQFVQTIVATFPQIELVATDKNVAFLITNDERKLSEPIPVFLLTGFLTEFERIRLRQALKNFLNGVGDKG